MPPDDEPWTDRALHECRFAVGQLVDEATLRRAAEIGLAWGVAPHQALLALGWVETDSYVRALAGHLDVGAVTSADPHFEPDLEPVLVDATTLAPDSVQHALSRAQSGGRHVLLAPGRAIEGIARARVEDRLIDRAVNGLLRSRPELSAGGPVGLWLLLALSAVTGLLAGGVAVAPDLAIAALVATLAIAFLLVVTLRIMALAMFAAAPRVRSSHDTEPIPDAALPVYTVLVPLFRETEVLPDLVRVLETLDYPAAKLDVILALESTDDATRIAAAGLDLPPCFRIVLVPDVAPRTKPKALNYALQFARGEFVVVYDAEDVPEADQLRRAVAMFRSAGNRIACVQACLNVYNARDSWLARQYALEYSALFDAILPLLGRLDLPSPLGGTSNHFPRQVLEDAGGWDPFNVTEDADLGIRLARMGKRVVMLSSTTWEEAPARFGVWFRQRTRWLKGWMQTWLVHMRHPRRLMSETGLRGFVGLQALMGGLILSALVHPLFYVMAIAEMVTGQILSGPDSGLTRALWQIAVFNLAAGYLSSIVLAAVAVIRRRWIALAMHGIFTPIYWLLISLAAYRAIFQLISAPHLWEKTDHAARPAEPREAASSERSGAVQY